MERIASASLVNLEAESAISDDTEMEIAAVSEAEGRQERYAVLSRCKDDVNRSGNTSR